MTVTIRRLPALGSALAACLVLAACKPATETRTAETAPAPSTAPAAKPASPATFSHDPALNAFGYYFTDADVRVGNLKLSSLNIGEPGDFADWEAGKRLSTYAPIFLVFDDVTSPTAVNEIGQAYHTVSVRVMPTAYRVDGQGVSFHGVDSKLGAVTLRGTFDLAALSAARAAGEASSKPVLRGDLQIGDRNFRDLSSLYYPGD